MRVLALDTTSAAGSLAVVEDDRVLAVLPGDPARSHAERLPADVLRVLEAAGTGPGNIDSVDSIDVYAVAVGPGSFTGLRIGIATIQGLAFVSRRRIVSVSALDALAHEAAVGRPAGAIVAAWIDAHRHEVFSALYRVGEDAAYGAHRLSMIEQPTVEPPAAVLGRWNEKDAGGAARAPIAVLAGNGAVRYKDLVPAAIAVLPPEPLATLAMTIGRIAVERVRADAGATLDPAGVQPLYVRRPDAEIARDAARVDGV